MGQSLGKKLLLLFSTKMMTETKGQTHLRDAVLVEEKVLLTIRVLFSSSLRTRSWSQI
jgi:hypothetical protein